MQDLVNNVLVEEFSGTFADVPPMVSGIRLGTALVLGGMIGLEREFREKPTGLRTNMLVSMAACLFILISQQLAAIGFAGGDAVRIDPLRLIEAVTAGVAFLAAGIIFRGENRVHNTTTGASMWMAGAVGLACGAGQIPLAAMATVMVILVLMVLRWLERWMGTH